MASPRGSAGFLGMVLLAGLVGARLIAPSHPALADETTLLADTFSREDVGARPGPWLYFTDEGNDVAVAQAPGLDGRCLKLVRSGGTVWKPMVSGWAEGQPDSPLRLEFDWYLPALSDGADSVLFVTLRGNDNINMVQVALGGPGGVAVPQDGDDWVPLGYRLWPGRWGHLCIVADPISRKGAGAFDLVVSQARPDGQSQERAEYPNIPFRPDHQGNYPDTLWYSPTFHVGGGSAEHPREAYVTNVKLTTTSPREYR
jgi:hypothetical protein